MIKVFGEFEGDPTPNVVPDMKKRYQELRVDACQSKR